MKILKFTLFLILCNVFFIGGLEAQILLNELQIKSSTNDASCSGIMPLLIIDRLDIIESLDKPLQTYITFNESDFENFDQYQIVRAPNIAQTTDNNNGHTIIDGNEFISDNPIIFIKVPQTGDEHATPIGACSSNFQIKAVCNGIEYFSNIASSIGLPCGSNELRKASEEHLVNVSLSFAPKIIYFKNLQGVQISSVSFYNLGGQELFTKMNNSSSTIFEINVSSLTSGMYIAKVFINEETFILKKVVVR